MPPAVPEPAVSTIDLRPAGRGRWAAIISAGAAIVLAVGVLLHVHGLNGPAYWKWDWIRLAATGWYAWMLVAATPAALALVIVAIGRRCGCRSPWRRLIAVGLLALAVGTMKLASQSCA